MKKSIFISVTIVMIVVLACTVASKKETSHDIRVFLSDFQKKLNSNEESVLKLFTGSQSKEEILKAIAILQNKDSIVKTELFFDDLISYVKESRVIIQIPVKFSGDGGIFSKNTSITFELVEKDGQHYIIKIDAERMYGEFVSLKNRIQNSDAYTRWLARITPFYDRAKELQKDYDSVIWYASTSNNSYYYVVNGQYCLDSLKKGAPQTYKMGLVDQTGKLIVPVEFALISNPSMVIRNAVEVTKDGKIGFYSLDGKQLLPVSYDWLVPYRDGSSIALVKNAAGFDWLDGNFKLHAGLPSPNAEKFLKDFSYLTDNSFAFGRGHQDLINVLLPLDHGLFNGNGLVVSSSYFVKNGILPAINAEFVTVDEHEMGQFGYAFEEDSFEKPFSISESLRAIISNIKNRYIGGRGEFYTSHRIILLNENGIVSSSFLSSGSNFQFRKLSNALYESKAVYEGEMMGYFGPMAEEANFPNYSYFEFKGDKLKPLSSNRFFQFTEFVKMDSSYLSGNFFIWRNDGRDSTKFASIETMQAIKDDILASYGFIFSTDIRKDFYKDEKWYSPKTESYDEVYDKATEIDKYNLDFLNRMIGSPGAKSM